MCAVRSGRPKKSVCTCEHVCVCACVEHKLLDPLSTHLTGISNVQSVAPDLIHFVSLFLPSFSSPVPLLCPADAPTATSSTTSILNTANKHCVCELRGLGEGQRQFPHFHKSRDHAAGHPEDSRRKCVCARERVRKRERVCVLEGRAS